MASRIDKRLLAHEKLISFFRKALRKIDIAAKDLAYDLPNSILMITLYSSGFTFEALTKVSELVDSKEINIYSDAEGGGPCSCEEGYCYCEGPSSYVVISAKVSANKISEILGK